MQRNHPSTETDALARRGDPLNAVALFYAAEGERDRGEREIALLYLQDLVRAWPTLADAWLVLGRLHGELGNLAEARRCILQARRRGVSVEEAVLPGQSDPG